MRMMEGRFKNFRFYILFLLLIFVGVTGSLSSVIWNHLRVFQAAWYDCLISLIVVLMTVLSMKRFSRAACVITTCILTFFIIFGLGTYRAYKTPMVTFSKDTIIERSFGEARAKELLYATPNLYSKEQLKSKNRIYVVYQLNCDFCNVVIPEILNHLSETEKDTVIFVNAQSEAGKEITKQYGVEHASTVVEIENGKEKAQYQLAFYRNDKVELNHDNLNRFYNRVSDLMQQRS